MRATQSEPSFTVIVRYTVRWPLSMQNMTLSGFTSPRIVSIVWAKLEM